MTMVRTDISFPIIVVSVKESILSDHVQGYHDYTTKQQVHRVSLHFWYHRIRFQLNIFSVLGIHLRMFSFRSISYLYFR